MSGVCLVKLWMKCICSFTVSIKWSTQKYIICWMLALCHHVKKELFETSKITQNGDNVTTLMVGKELTGDVSLFNCACILIKQHLLMSVSVIDVCILHEHSSERVYVGRCWEGLLVRFLKFCTIIFFKLKHSYQCGWPRPVLMDVEELWKLLSWNFIFIASWVSILDAFVNCDDCDSCFQQNKIDTILYNLQSNDWFINILCNLISIGLGYSFVI